MGGSVEFGNMLRELRLKAQITQEGLAERAGLSARAISGLERGDVRRPQNNTVILLAKALGLRSAASDAFIEAARGRPRHIGLELCARDDGDDQDITLHTFREPVLAVWARTAPPVPAYLPLDTQGLVGRETQLAQLKSYVEGANGAACCCPVSVVITGMLGTGKTALAVRFAHELSQKFPDGQFFIDLMGHRPEQAIRWRVAMKTLLNGLGVTDEELLSDEKAILDTYRRMTAGRRLILVLDNAADEDQIRPLLPMSSSCLAVITSRKRLTSLVVTEGAKAIVLGSLPKAAAVNLILDTVGQRGELAAACRLAEVSGSLPLALRVVASKAVMETDKSLSVLARKLESPVAWLELSAALPQRPLRLRDMFADFYNTLSSDLARAFRMLGLVFSNEFSSTQVAFMMKIDPDVARDLLERLADVYLVEQTSLAERFRIHPLWHAYAQMLVEEEEIPESRVQAVRRLLRYYLDETTEATRKLRPAWPGLSEDDTRCAADTEEARAGKQWLDREQTNLYMAVHVALEQAEYDIAWRLAFLVGSFLSLRKRWLDWVRVLQDGLSAARRAGDSAAEVKMLTALGFVYLEIRHLPRAADCLNEALVKVGSGSCEMVSHLLRLGLEASSFGHAGSLTVGQAVVPPQLGWHVNDGYFLLGFSYLYRQIRLLDLAESHARMAVKVFGEAGCRTDEAVSYMELGRVLQAEGELLESISCFESALYIWQDLDEPLAQGECLFAVGECRYTMGQVKETEMVWAQAHLFFDARDDNLATITLARLRRLQANDPDTLSESAW